MMWILVVILIIIALLIVVSSIKIVPQAHAYVIGVWELIREPGLLVFM